MNANTFPHAAIRQAMARFELASRVEPNADIQADKVFLPSGHRGVLDLRRQLVVGNRGMGKSFWTHALGNPDVRNTLATHYRFPELGATEVRIGFNGSDKKLAFAPSVHELAELLQHRTDSPELIWKALLLRIAQDAAGQPVDSFPKAMDALHARPSLYSEALSHLDDELYKRRRHLLVVFDALDRLAPSWNGIQDLSRALLRLAIGLQSFHSIRAKIFMRVDLFSDLKVFQFPDSSKIKSDHVSLVWQPAELYGLLLFEILRNRDGNQALTALATQTGTAAALPVAGDGGSLHLDLQRRLVHALAGEFMGSNKKRGQVYTWVPLHLSDAANTCSPRTFLTAWQKAAERLPAPTAHAVDHQGLLDGVRSASRNRLNELYEDYGWIRPALEALKSKQVPMSRDQLFALWAEHRVWQTLQSSGPADLTTVPAGLSDDAQPEALLAAMKAVAVMEERSNGKINVPDIFRVDAGILRKGGVAVPKRH